MTSGKFLDDESKKIVERVVVVMSFFISIAYGVLLCVPTGWHTKVTQIWSFYIGLWNVKVRADTLGGTILKKLCNGVSSTGWKRMSETLNDGDHDIQRLRDEFCNADMFTGGFLNNCWIWTQFMYGSWAMGLSLVITIVFLLAGAGMTCAKPTKCIRWAGLGCYCTAAFFNAGGCAGYAFLTMNMSNWLMEIYGSHGGLTFSMASLFAGTLSLGVILLPFMVFACTMLPSRYDDDEDDGYGTPVDQYGNPIPVDQYGNPIPVDQYGNPVAVDQYGNPLPPSGPTGSPGPVDQYGNPVPVDQYGYPIRDPGYQQGGYQY